MWQTKNGNLNLPPWLVPNHENLGLGSWTNRFEYALYKFTLYLHTHSRNTKPLLSKVKELQESPKLIIESTDNTAFMV